MHLDKYDYQISIDYHTFIFYSVGPIGTISKAVNFQGTPELLHNGMSVINLGFGDWDDELGEIDDFIISNNSDRDKILATIAATVADYTNKYRGRSIYAQGSTLARTRLYQMSICKNLEAIEKMFYVFGRCNGHWLLFRTGVNFDAFLVVRK